LIQQIDIKLGFFEAKEKIFNTFSQMDVKEIIDILDETINESSMTELQNYELALMNHSNGMNN